VFSAPAIGGWIGDKVLGARRTMIFGACVLASGYLMLSIPFDSLGYLYAALGVIVVGNGLFKANAANLVRRIYEGDDARLDSAFTIYYMSVNIGSTISMLATPWIKDHWGWHAAFAVCFAGMVLGLIQYQLSGKWLGQAGMAPHPAAPRERKRAQRLLTAALAALAVLVLLVMFGVLPISIVQLANVTGAVMIALAIAFFGNVLLFGNLATAEKKSVAVIAIFFICAAVFWAGYEQAGSTLNLFARDHTDRSFLGSWFASGEHPVSWYQIAQAVFVLSLAPVFAWIWISLGKRGRDPSAGAKFGLGLLQLGLSFLVMMVAAQTVLHTGHRVLPLWLIITYLLQTTGEMCLSPIGLSNVTKLAPARYSAQMMGTWFLGAAIGNLAAGLIGGEIGADLTDMPAQFLRMALVGGASGCIMLALARPVRAWMGAAR